ncbi:phosphotransferase family protein [Microlunatus speluncae]|uniref:phosphotransferase family protein n=1 Tax=Microlunatus speluncae TaxID=2594267 RepID=UPI0013757180|nr:aminoglycoside phosphotransferase family protein [Microlunatus speluncae]
MSNALVEPALAALRRDRPDLARPPLRTIYTGFSSVVVSTGSGFTVRIGRNQQAGDTHERKWRVVSLLDDLPVAVPRPEWQVPPGPEVRFGAAAYPTIEGITLPWDRPVSAEVVGQLARFLARLHGITDPAVRDSVDSLEVWRTWVLEMVESSIALLAGELSSADHGRLTRWHRAEFVPRICGLGDRDVVVVHGDFWHDNLVIGPDGLAGVIDWEAAELADPAVDLAPVWDIDPALGAALLRGYQDQLGPDGSLAERVRLFRIARNLGGVAWSVDNDDAEEYADSLLKVRSVLPLLA